MIFTQLVLSNTGGFVPKRASGENYIPLHGANYFVEKVDDKLMASNSMKSKRICAILSKFIL